MRVILGPMEGVLDHLMRDMLTQINDYDFCVTEFVRVVNLLLPDHVFIASALNCDRVLKPVRCSSQGATAWARPTLDGRKRDPRC